MPRPRGARYPRTRRPGASGAHEDPAPHIPALDAPAPARRARVAGRVGRRGKLALAGALVLLVLLGVAGPASAFSSQYAFTITGHGWGHGVGMSQWGAYGYAKHGWDYKAILKHYYTGISFSDVADSVIRVNLRSGQSAIKLSCPNEYTVQGTGAASTIPGGTTATTTHTSSGYRVVAGSLRKTFTGAPTFTPSAGSLRLITKTDLGDDGAYRGTIRVVYSGGLMMINHVPLESYLRGVVPHEVSPSWPRESLKAQACAARAFALGSRQSSKAWDVYCDVRDQAYVGVGIEDSRTDAAVRDTAGVCPTYDGKPIVATYFSCSGGHTESVGYVWGGTLRLPQGRGRPLRLLRLAARLGPAAPLTVADRRPAGRERHAARRLHGQARRLAAHRQGGDHRQRRDQVHRRQLPAHEARAEQLLGRLQEHGHQPGGPRRREHQPRAAASP